MTHAKLLARITARPDVFGGKPVVMPCSPRNSLLACR